MRILLDESLPRRLRQHLPANFIVKTVQELVNAVETTPAGQLGHVPHQ